MSQETVLSEFGRAGRRTSIFGDKPCPGTRFFLNSDVRGTCAARIGETHVLGHGSSRIRTCELPARPYSGKTVSQDTVLLEFGRAGGPRGQYRRKLCPMTRFSSNSDVQGARAAHIGEKRVPGHGPQLFFPESSAGIF